MQRTHPVVFVALITILFCLCNSPCKAQGQPASSPPATGAVSQQLVGEPSTGPDGKKTGLAGYHHFPPCGVEIRQPEGFEKADSFDGFEQRATGAGVAVMCLPAPYSQTTAGFSQEHMRAAGWIPLSYEEVKIADTTGILVHFEQPAGNGRVLKWTLAFGDEQATTIITAVFTKTHESTLSARLKSALLSTRFAASAPRDPAADLPFTLTASPKLKLTRGINSTLTYTKGGVFPAQSPEEPLFLVTPSLGEAKVGDRRHFAAERLYELAQRRELEVTSVDAITIDGLEGYESLAETKDTESGAPLTIYQVMLFDDSSYILMVGLVASTLRDEYLPDFKSMARSLRQKRP